MSRRFLTSVAINGATASNPLDVKTDTDQSVRVKAYGGKAVLEAVNLAGSSWVPVSMGGSTFAVQTAGSDRITVSGTGLVTVTGDLTVNGTLTATLAPDFSPALMLMGG